MADGVSSLKYTQLQIILSLPNKLRGHFTNHKPCTISFGCPCFVILFALKIEWGRGQQHVWGVKRTKERSNTNKVLVLCELQGTVPNE